MRSDSVSRESAAVRLSQSPSTRFERLVADEMTAVGRRLTMVSVVLVLAMAPSSSTTKAVMSRVPASDQICSRVTPSTSQSLVAPPSLSVSMRASRSQHVVKFSTSEAVSSTTTLSFSTSSS